MENLNDPSPEEQRDKRVSIAIVFFWGTTLTAWLCSWVWPTPYDSFLGTIEPVEPVIALIYGAMILYVVYACLRHVHSDRYKGAHPYAWSLFFLAGHVISTTIYHFLVVLRR